MSTVIYEVTLSVPPAREREFDDWLREHISEILALPGFEKATMWRVESPSPTWTVQYQLPNRQALDEYFTNHAAKMRRPGIQRFGEDLQASRRILLEPSRG